MSRTDNKSHSIGKRTIALAVLAAFHSLTTAQVAQNTTTHFQYDANGNVTQIADPLGHVTNQKYDALNRLQQQIQPAPKAGAPRPTIAYTYDGQDQLVSVTDPRNLVTRYTVDGLGNQTALASPDAGITNKTYDEAGNVKTVTDARGKTATYSYDALNRITSISYPTGASTAFTWDVDNTPGTYPKGRLVIITDESGSTHYTYDIFGHVTSKTVTPMVGGASYTITYRYDTNAASTGHLFSMTYPSGNRINYTYDADGRIASLTLNPGKPDGSTDTTTSTPILTGIQYHPLGLPTAWAWGNSTATAPNTYARSIDLDGRITSYPLGNALNNGTVRTVAYDAASRITGTTHSGTGAGNNAPANFNQNYGYDDLDRLTSFTAQATSQAYGYDANGNRTSLAIGANSYADTIDAASNKLTATAGPTPAQTNAFDAAGNETGNGTTTFTYSDRGRLASAQTSAGTTAYLYNGLNQRVSKAGSAVAGGSNGYAYDEAGHLIGEYDATGKAIEETVYLGDMPVAVLK